MPTSQEWRQKAEQWVPAFMAAHPTITNADVLFAEMRKSDMYVPRTYVREEWRFRKAQADYMDIVERMDDDQIIPRGWMKPTAQGYSDRYVWKATLTGRLAETGQAVERNVTIESAKNEKVGTVLDVAWGYAAQYGLDLFEAPPTITIIEAMYTS